MIKLLGLTAVSISVFLFFNQKLIQAYSTHIFLIETIDIIEHMKTGCMLGKTYNNIFAGIDYTKYCFYVYGTEYKNVYLITEKGMNTVNQLFDGIGLRNKKAETDFLNISKENIMRVAEEYKDYYVSNKKTNLLAAVSLILIIVIVVI